MNRILICAGLLSLVFAMENGDFEKGFNAWESKDAKLVDAGRAGTKALLIQNEESRWEDAVQWVSVSAHVKEIEISGWMKTEKVEAGEKEWEKARITVEFYNSKKNRLGKFPTPVGETTGSTPWNHYVKRYKLPRGTQFVKVIAALANAEGKAWFDDFSLKRFDESGKELAQGELPATVKSQVDPEEALYNPGFEKGDEGWNLWGGEISQGALRSGAQGIKIENKEHRWSGADQILELPEGTRTVEVSGWMKAEWVTPGEKSWEQARIGVEFLDAGGKLHGGYVPVVGETKKNTGWVHYQRNYPVRTGAKKVKIQLALGNARGEVFYDDLSVKIKDAKGGILLPPPITGPVAYGEYYPFPKEKSTRGGHYVDWSGLLDAPAGKHGFLKVKEEEFVFEDGTPIKFWGTNLVAKDLFPSKADADSLAKRLAKMGANLLRLHHADAPWSNPNLFGNAEGTRKLDSTSLEKLDYLIAALKKKGIYIFMDWLVHREFTTADGVEVPLPDRGGKQVGFFNPQIIDLQKEFISQLMNHKNVYTGLKYKDEPAIVASEFINESSIFTHFTGDLLGEGPYRKELEAQFKEAGNEGVLPTFGLNWDTGRGVLKVENSGDDSAAMKFLYDKELGYYQDMYQFARKEGIKYPLAGSNFPPPILAAMKANATLDFTITNEYWDHPKVWLINNDWARRLYAPFDNSSQLKSPGKNLVHSKSFFKVENKPMMITEWNHCYPNEYQVEGVPLMAAYGALQGWNGILQFDTYLKALGEERIESYTLGSSPEDVVNWVMAAPLYHRGDVKKAPGIVVEGISDKTALQVPSYSTFLDQNKHLPFVTRVAKSYEKSDTTKIDELGKYHDAKAGTILSETQELAYQYLDGIVGINTERIQGAFGDLSKSKFEFEALELKAKNPQMGLFLISATKEELAKAKLQYLVISTPSKMEGQVYNRSRNGLENIGEGSLLIQIPEGELTLKALKGKKVQVFGLYPNGEVEKEYPITESPEGPTLTLNDLRSPVLKIEVK